MVPNLKESLQIVVTGPVLCGALEQTRTSHSEREREIERERETGTFPTSFVSSLSS